MTRRVVKPQPEQRGTCGSVLSGVPAWYWSSPRYDNGDGVKYFHTDEEAARRLMVRACPYGVPGDRLYVKEAIRRVGENPDGRIVSVFDADGEMTKADAWPWKRDLLVARFMPRGLRRLTLEVTDVRVQRVQDIRPADYEAEGIVSGYSMCNLEARYSSLGRGFRALWDSLNAKRGHGWDANPFVWCISFRRITP